ncbi:MAG TPA: glycosyltransferase family 4 protein [Lacibacter sp.]|nr:glycosyltransferase family 4 protein [Lacibacter sp.]HMO88651.1 glycosyltransferase family 4 protein [Lacibacter sp.]
MLRPDRYRLLLLSAFSYQGGIEKFNRALMKAFTELGLTGRLSASAAVLHDQHSPDERYTNRNTFRFYKGSIPRFLLDQFYRFARVDVLVLGHVNLAIAGLLYKWLFPSRKLMVVCHGIEVFNPLQGLRSRILRKADRLLAVSGYTRTQLMEVHNIPAEKISIFPNTLDPYFELPENFVRPDYLCERYGIDAADRVLFTLTRLNAKEGYKGYDRVLRILPSLLAKGLPVKYVIAGKADEDESLRLQELIRDLRLEDQVIITGFVPDEEITDHFLLADAYVMPSKGEGFGIVFIEAMACGLPVIAGNKDGSTEALQHGKLGLLVDPDSPQEIEDAVIRALQQPRDPERIRNEMLEHFSFDRFRQRLQEVLF